MRERITFIHPPDQPYDPSKLRVTKNEVEIKKLAAAREDKISFALDELPVDISQALKQCHEIHIRWISPTFYKSASPFNARLPPGLHVAFTPLPGRPTSLVCPLLKKAFSEKLKCVSPEISFTRAPVLSERFATAATYTFYQYVKWPVNLISFITQRACRDQGPACLQKSSSLAGAEYIDIDYDAISQSLVLKSLRQMRPRRGLWDEVLRPFGDSRLEVGILSIEKLSDDSEPESIKLSGFLITIGEDSKPKPTLFEFPSRHHEAPVNAASKYSTRLIHPTGLHPTLQLSLDSSAQPPAERCALHAYLTLPSHIFFDKYQLEPSTFRVSRNLGPIRTISGETDLEAPDWAVDKWGSMMLIELKPPPREPDQIWSAEIPLHLRYMPPIAGGLSHVHVPWPSVFWACRADEGTKMSTNPFDRTNLGYDGLFGPKTMFYHLNPNNTEADGLVEGIDVPVLDSYKTTFTGPSATVVLALGVLWVLAKILRANRRTERKTKSQ